MQTHVENARPLTGRKVFLAFAVFFVIIAGMNAVLLRLATSTFGGVEVASAYRAGLALNNEIAAAERQDSLHWTVDAEFVRRTGDTTGLVVRLQGADGKPVFGLDIAARLIHPADGRRADRLRNSR